MYNNYYILNGGDISMKTHGYIISSVYFIVLILMITLMIVWGVMENGDTKSQTFVGLILAAGALTFIMMVYGPMVLIEKK